MDIVSHNNADCNSNTNPVVSEDSNSCNKSFKRKLDLKKLLAEGYFKDKDREICPICGKNTFCINPDKTLAKCFHPICGIYATEGPEDRYSGFYSIMDYVYKVSHNYLIKQYDEDSRNVYSYLESRHIHPDVITSANLGVLSKDDMIHGVVLANAYHKFDAEIEEERVKLKASLSEIGLTYEDYLSRETQPDEKKYMIEKIDDTVYKFMTEAKEKFMNFFENNKGNLLFFYTDKHYNIKSIKARVPYSKQFQWFKPFRTRQGFFRLSADNFDNDNIILTEGEFNFLQLQSLAKRAGKGYVNCASFGGSSGNWQEELKKTGWNPTFTLDNDDAGKAVVRKVTPYMTCHAVTVPGSEGADLDSYISEMEPWLSDENAQRAWNEVELLLQSAKEYFWTPDITAFIKTTNTGKKFVDTTAVGEYFCNRYKVFTCANELYIYKDGFYSNFSDFIPSEVQALLQEYTKNNVISEICSFIKRRRILKPDELNPKAKTLINLSNGMLDWKSLKLFAHSPDYLSTIRIPVIYRPGVDCLNIKAFLSSLFPNNPDNIKLLEEITGIGLVPYTDLEKWFLLTGSGSNGKSTFIDILSKMIGPENISNVSLQNLCGDDRFALSQLQGKLLNIYDDLDSTALKELGNLKIITSGKSLSAQRKFQDIFSFTPYARLLFSCNELPNSWDKSTAYFRRLVIIAFNQTFEGSKRQIGLINTLSTDEEMSGFLNLALKGLHRVIKNRRFSENEETDNLLKEYKEIIDPVRSFMTEKCLLGPDQKVKKQFLYDRFKSYCENDLNLKGIMGRNIFYKQLENREKIKTAPKHLRIDDQQTFIGINFVSASSEPENKIPFVNDRFFKESPNGASDSFLYDEDIDDVFNESESSFDDLSFLNN